jgi:hypothetical protein
MNEPQPEVVEMGDGRQEKKSGSFFDQIWVAWERSP